MNIYEEVKKVNLKNQNRIALGLRKENGETLKYTYREMFDKVELCNNNLKKIGLKKGNRIGIVAPSSSEWVINYLAIQEMNGTAVLLDYSLEKDDLLKLIEKSDLRAIITSNEIKEKIGISQNVPMIDVTTFGKLFKESSNKISKAIIEEDYKISSIIYSSGTTRMASGIMHTHDSLINTTYMTIKAVGLKKKSVFMGMLPNSHIYGVITQILGPLLLGGSVYNLEKLDGENLIGAFKEYKPKIFPTVPKVYELLYSQILAKINSKNFTKIMFKKLFPICLNLRRCTGINLGKIVFSSIHKGFGGKLKTLSCAGAPISKEVADFFYGTGFDMLITYGATETNIPTLGNFGKNITTNSCGKNYPDVQIKISDNGELLIKSPYMMVGYFNDKEQTTNTFTEDGWFKTGDLAKINNKGNVEILGRCKENIVLATGKKVAPDDIENNYQNIPFIKDMAICGIPSKNGSYDEVHCFVVAEVGKEEKIQEILRKKSNESSMNMKITGIHFVNEIPRTALQKPKRFLLRKSIENADEKSQSVAVVNQAVTLKEIVYSVIAKIAKVEIQDVTDNTRFLEELPIDSLSVIELELELEKMYGIDLTNMINKNTTAIQLVNLIENPPMTPKEKLKQYLTKYPLKRKDGDYKIFKFYTNLIKKIYKVNVVNEEVLPDDSAYIICSNHVSNFDYLYLTANFCQNRFKKLYCLAKRELFTNGLLNRVFTRVSGMIPVERAGIATETIKKAKEKLKEKCGIVIFPEGTRSKDGNLGVCKQGAAMISLETNTPIIPAYIQGAYVIYPPTKKLPKFFNWKTKTKYEVNVIYGEPIKTEGKTIEQITKELHDAILKLACKYDNKEIVMA